jgi:hypothetical protein
MSHGNDPAHPVHHFTTTTETDGRPKPLISGGLTKREYFAAAISISWADAIALLELRGNKRPTYEQVCAARVEMRIQEADLLLAELRKVIS